MKTKVIMSLLMIAAVVLGSAIAIADNFTASPLTDVTSGGWTTTQGSFATNGGGNGIISNNPAYTCKAVHPVTTTSSGAFSFESTFKLNNASCDVHVGVGTDSSDLTVGWIHSGHFAVVKDNNQIMAFIGASDSLDPAATYTGKITSTDGNSFTCSIYQGSNLVGTTTVLGFKPTNVVVYIENYNAANGPTIYSVNFQSQASPSPSPSPSPSTTPSSVNFDLQAMRDFYAHQPIVHMSNQSVIYNPDGTIKQVITGNQTVTTPTATPAMVKPNATATPAPVKASVTAVPSAPVATKTQAPGFEIVLAAIGMISALVLITRKKK